MSSTEIERSVGRISTGHIPCVLNDMVPLCDLGFVVNLSDDTNLLCVKTLKRAAGPNGTEPGGMDYLQ